MWGENLGGREEVRSSVLQRHMELLTSSWDTLKMVAHDGMGL